MFNALIRTHHITSRKKIARLKTAAKLYNCHALLRSGGVPGVMFVEGRTSADVQNWVNLVHDLRYKDYELVAPVRPIVEVGDVSEVSFGSLRELSTVKEMGAVMEARGLTKWWRAAMGFVH